MSILSENMSFKLCGKRLFIFTKIHNFVYLEVNNAIEFSNFKINKDRACRNNSDSPFLKETLKV